jgi:hypothetical protein
MGSLAELLDQAVGPLPTDPHLDDLLRRVRRRRHRRRSLVAVAAVGVLVAGALVWSRPDASREVKTVGPGVFHATTGVVLVASDGYDGATFIDLDHRTAVRRLLEGERVGDQPYRLAHVGNELIVGWGDVHAVPLDGGPARLLSPKDVVYVPAAEPNTVWLFDYDQLGLAWQVDLAGKVLHEVHISGFPLRGVAGGLLTEPNVIVDSTTGASRSISSGRIEVGDVLGSKLLWSTPGTTQVHVTDVTTAEDRVFDLGPEVNVMVGGGRFSPDGRWVAVPDSREVMVFDIRTGARRTVGTRLPHPSLAWAPDSSQLFLTGNSYTKETTSLLRFDVRAGTSEAVDLPFGGALTTIALPSTAVTALLRAPRRTPAACRPPSVMPRGRIPACAFTF